MNPHPLRPVVRSIALMTLIVQPPLMGAAWAQASAPVEPTLKEVTIVQQREDRVSSGATGLDLDIKETPQSISIVTTEQMRDFGTSNLNEALRLSTGIIVDEWETNRTTFTARGFDIANTQIDGVGLPNDWGIVTGAMDSFGYEKIEVIRGANGLLTGVGNAAGTINFVRKRPTNKEQGSLGLSYGSWGTTRVEADYSRPLTADRRWAGRVVAAREEGGSHLRSFDRERTFLYGVVDGQVGDNGLLTLGLSHQQSDSTGNMWGALTFMNADGTQNAWGRNASTTQDWTRWDTTTKTAFVEYAHQIGMDWQLKLAYNYRAIDNDSKLFYAFPSGSSLVGYAWGGKDTMDAHLATATVNGRFEMLGRQHEALFGVSWAKSEYTGNGYAGSDCGASACSAIALPGFPYPGNLVPEPQWGPLALESTLNQKLQRAFGTMRFTLTDRLKAVVGVNHAQYSRDGTSYGVASDLSRSKTSPYTGLTFEFTPSVLGYVSYSDLYFPQSQADANDRYLDPSKGTNYEAGLKADWLDKRLLTSVAVFQAKQSGLATPTGTYNQNGQAVYAPEDVKSTGVELEAVGRLNNHIDLTAGYTTLKLTGPDGGDTYAWVPRHTANLALKARLPSLPALSFGTSARWQSKISNMEASGFTVRQGSYAVLNAFVAWQLQPKTTLRFNVNNITDEKYINTLRYAGYYGAPRSYQLSLNHQF